MEGEAIRKEGRDDEGKTNLDLIEWEEEEPEQANIIEALFFFLSFFLSIVLFVPFRIKIDINTFNT